MPSTDRKLELKAKTSMAQTASQAAVYAKGLTALSGTKPRVLSCQHLALSVMATNCHLTTRHSAVQDMNILCNRDFSQFSLHYIQAQIAQPVQIPGNVPDDPPARIQVGAIHFYFAQNSHIQKHPIKLAQGV
jgi:hypothetical protein